MQTASFATLIENLLIIVACYYVFKFLAKLFLPVLVKKVVQKAEQNIHQQFNSQQRQQNTDQVIYNAPKSDKPRETKKVGEYVDYEEID